VGWFDNISHDFLLKVLGDVPGKALIQQWLKAGYLEEGRYHDTPTGTPQGGVISPLLSNLYLDEVDKMLERAKETTRNGKYTYRAYAR